jgi:hypothetical protein
MYFGYMGCQVESFETGEHNSHHVSGKSLHKGLGTRLDYSLAYHPQTDGQTEQVNQILEDMLRACVLTYEKRLGKELIICKVLLQQ